MPTDSNYFAAYDALVAAREEAKTKAEAKERVLPQRFEYKIVRVECNGRADSAVQADADQQINDMAGRGWRLHTYSHVGLGSGAGMAITSHNMTNVLNLVFEREVG